MILGDCLEVMPSLPRTCAHKIFCDLPYGITANRWDVSLPLEDVWSNLLSVATESAPFVFTATQPFATDLICSKRNLFRYDLIWAKHKLIGHLSANKRPMRCHEHVLYFNRRQGTYNPQKTQNHPHRSTWRKVVCDSKNYGKITRSGLVIAGQNVEYSGSERHPGSVLPHFHGTDTATHRNNRLLHPTQKPIALMDWLLRSYSNPGDLVLDPVSGSGTTAIAAALCGRSSICIEKDPGYFEASVERLRKTVTDGKLDVVVEIRR